MSRNRRGGRPAAPAISVGGSDFTIGPAAAALNADALAQAGVTIAQTADAMRNLQSAAAATGQTLANVAAPVASLTSQFAAHTQGVNSATQAYSAHSTAVKTLGQQQEQQHEWLNRSIIDLSGLSGGARQAAGSLLSFAGINPEMTVLAAGLNLVEGGMNAVAAEGQHMLASASFVQEWQRQIGALPATTRTFNDAVSSLDAARTSLEALVAGPSLNFFTGFLDFVDRKLQDLAENMAPGSVTAAMAKDASVLPGLIVQATNNLHDYEMTAARVRLATEAQVAPLEAQLRVMERQHQHLEQMYSLYDAQKQLQFDASNALDFTSGRGDSARAALLGDQERMNSLQRSIAYTQQVQAVQDKEYQITTSANVTLHALAVNILDTQGNLYQYNQGIGPNTQAALDAQARAAAVLPNYQGTGFVSPGYGLREQAPYGLGGTSFYNNGAAPGTAPTYGFGGTSTYGPGSGIPFEMPHRAQGGPVWANQTYWVGENGPEPFTPSQNGYISPAGQGAQHLLGLCLSCHKEFAIQAAADPRVADATYRGMGRVWGR
jgi:hypothetical protein